MGKIIEFPRGISKEEWAHGVLEAILKADKVAVVLNMPDEGQVWTAYYDCTCVDKQVMIGHMQVDVIHESMNATYQLEPVED